MTKKTSETLIYLDKEDDSVEHVRWLGDQRRSLEELHNQLLRYMQPLQADLASKQSAWWRRIYTKYKLDPSKGYALHAEHSLMPYLEPMEADVARLPQASGMPAEGS